MGRLLWWGGRALATLNDARVRQYTQQTTTCPQRLDAEKRSATINKPKRQG